MKPLAQVSIHSSFANPISVHIDQALQSKSCPHFAGRTIRGVKNGASPAWLQARLRAIGLRPISALVDITNYFTFGLNRPLHVFDLAAVSGGALHVHAAQGGESFAALDGKTYDLRAGQTVISDANGILSLAGIMGGAHSGCSPETIEVFLESAFWDPITTATTGRALRINSDALNGVLTLRSR
jgi:phenylalanyl-tRNA synthetase beta chain